MIDSNRANRLVGILQPFTLMFRDILTDTNVNRTISNPLTLRYHST